MTPDDHSVPDALDSSGFERWSERDDAALSAMFSELQDSVARERGPRGWLRALDSRTRLLVGTGLSLGLVGVVVVGSPRPDLGDIPVWRLAITFGLTVVLLGASVWFGLRPLHRPPVALWVEPAVVVVALLGICGLAFLPLLGPLPADSGGWKLAFPCLFGGLAIGVPSFLLIRLLDRGGRPFSAFLAAAAAALGANAALAAYCPKDSLGHVLQNHASLGFVFVGAVAIWRWGMTYLSSVTGGRGSGSPG